MAILLELSELVIKQAALIASRYPNKTLLSVIEECFEYGAKSLYSDAPKPVPPQRKPPEEYFTTPIEDRIVDSITQNITSIAQQAQSEYSTVYSDEDLPENLGEPIVNPDGSFEL